jgi:hypothetical protein
MKKLKRYFIFPLTLIGLLLVLPNSCDLMDDDILDDPGNLTEYRDQVGETLRFRVTGTETGTVWGGANGIYTDDSKLAKAAVHAGKVKIGEQKIVRVTILAGQDSYTGNTQNGIVSIDWPSWPGSFRFD